MPFSVVVLVAPLTAEPIVMLVVLPESPAVPILIVLVLPEVVAPPWMLVVCEAVDWPNVMLLVALVAPMIIVPVAIRLTDAKLEVDNTPDVDRVADAVRLVTFAVPVSVGLADRTTLPVPVLSAKSVKPKSQPAAVVTAVLIQTI